MTDQQELVAALMAELTGRFENLAALTVAQHRPEAIERNAVDAITKETFRALVITRAASVLAHDYAAVICDDET